MVRRAARLPPELASRAFTVAEAREQGVGENRLRRHDLERPFHGVRVAVDGGLTLLDRCHAALTVLPAGSAFTHATALELLGVDVPGTLASTALHVRVPCDVPRPARSGIVVHSSRVPVSVRTVDGLPAVTPEAAWLDCAPGTDADTLVVVGDALVRRRMPVSTVAKLESAVAGVRTGARGSARIRAALPDVRPGTDSLMETRTRLLLVRGGLPCPRVNQPVLGERGEFLAMPDMLYPEARVAIEYDGDVHRTDRRTWMRDIRRRETLQAAGWLVLTATADDVLRHPDPFVRRVRDAVRSRTRVTR